MKRGFTIRQKILLSFFVLIAVYGGYGLYNIFILNQNSAIIQNIQKVVDPSFDAIKDFKLLVERSQRLTIGWIYTPQTKEEKDQLKAIQDIEYPKLKENLQTLMKNWSDTSQIAKIDSVFKDFEGFIQLQKKEVMEKILSVQDQEGEMILNMTILVEDRINPQARNIIGKLNRIEQYKRQEKEKAQNNLLTSSRNLTVQIIVLIAIVIVIGIAVAFTLTANIVQPITYINKVISQLSKGELPEDKRTRFRRDEIGEIASSVDNLIRGLRSTSEFADAIGQGMFRKEFQPLSDKDVLGNALIRMRDNLEKVAEQDSIRNWKAEGVSKFADLLRQYSENLDELADQIISNLVKKLGANQGGLFIVTKEGEEEYLRLAACYAWDKKKYLEQKVYRGDGLTGQAWQEQASIYLTEVPNNYVTITSGLGHTNPRSILIVPLKANEQVFGVVEIASITEIEPYKREFVEQIAESIASTIFTVQNRQETERLLTESRTFAEQMKNQEELLRQNVEALQEAQEEMERNNLLTMERETILQSTHMVFRLSRKFTINEVNELASNLLYYAPEELIGMNIAEIFSKESVFEEMKLTISRNEFWSGITTVKAKGGDEVLVKITAGSLGTGMGNINKYIIFMDNINEIRLLQN